MPSTLDMSRSGRITSSIADDQLENTVCKVLPHIGANITDGKIESCHRLNKSTDRTIVKFLRRKDYDQVMRVKSELKTLKPADLDVPEGTKLCINESLCPYYRAIGVCGTSAGNYGIGANYFLFFLFFFSVSKDGRLDVSRESA